MKINVTKTHQSPTTPPTSVGYTVNITELDREHDKDINELIQKLENACIDNLGGDVYPVTQRAIESIARGLAVKEYSEMGQLLQPNVERMPIQQYVDENWRRFTSEARNKILEEQY